MNRDPTIRAQVIAETSGYSKGMADAAEQTDALKRRAEAASAPMTGMQAVMRALGPGALVAGAALGTVADASLGLARNTAAVADEIGQQAAQIGISTREMSEYRYAAQITGMSTGALASGLSSLTEAIEEDSGALQAMGVATRDAAGNVRPLGDVLRDVAGKFAGYQAGAAKGKLGNELFGGSFDAWLPLLDRGADGLRDLTDEAHTFGLVVDDEAAAAARAFNEDLRRLQGMIPALVVELGGPLVSVLGELTAEFLDARRAGLSFLEALGGIGLANPMQSAQAHMERVRGELAALRADMEKPWYQRSPVTALAGEGRAEQLEKELAYWERQAKREFDRGFFGPPTPLLAAPDVPGTPKKPRAPRAPTYVDPLADEAKAYGAAMQMIAAAQLDAETSSWNLSATQQRLLEVMTLPEWHTMPEHWRAEIAAKAEAAIAAEELAQQQARLNTLLGTDELERQREDMQLLADALLAGSINADVYAEAVQRALGTLPKPIDEAKDQFRELQKAIEGWGEDSARAIVDFAVTGKASFSDMVNSMLADMARMVVQQKVTSPLASALGGINWASLWPFADGGVMSGAGPVPLRKYASGGIANSPQLALYAEGSRPEAYVPLPDGRTIPVTMRGGGGLQSLKVEIRNESSQPMRVVEAQPRIDVDGMVVQVVLRDLRNNGPIRQALGGR